MTNYVISINNVGLLNLHTNVFPHKSKLLKFRHSIMYDTIDCTDCSGVIIETEGSTHNYFKFICGNGEMGTILMSKYYDFIIDDEGISDCIIVEADHEYKFTNDYIFNSKLLNSLFYRATYSQLIQDFPCSNILTVSHQLPITASILYPLNSMDSYSQCFMLDKDIKVAICERELYVILPIPEHVSVYNINLNYDQLIINSSGHVIIKYSSGFRVAAPIVYKYGNDVRTPDVIMYNPHDEGLHKYPQFIDSPDAGKIYMLLNHQVEVMPMDKAYRYLKHESH